MGVGHNEMYFGRDSSTFLIQPPAHSRASIKAQAGCWGPCPNAFWKSPRREVSEFLWVPVAVLSHSLLKIFFLHPIRSSLVWPCSDYLSSYCCALL